MSWDKYKLSDICKIGDGAHASLKRQMNGIPYLTAKNITKNGIDYSSLDYISEETYLKHFKEKSNALTKPQKNDILYSIIGSIGGVYIVKDEIIGISSSVAIFRCNDDVIPEYLYYYMKSSFFDSQIQALRGGVAQGFMSLSKLSTIEVPCPPLETQRRIVSILSAYDDLIENNQKQIKLLEEAAQRLYKEWFVDLRFPGYEDIPIVDGVPEGWEKCLLSDVADVNKLNLPKNNEYDSIDYIDLSSVKKGRILEKTRYKINEAPGRAKRLAIDGDIIWGMVRPNLCSYALVMHPNERDVFSTGFAVISSKKVPFSYLYCLATEESFIGYLVNCTNGAAYPAVKPIHFEEAKILKPVDEILNQFHSIAEPIYRKIEALDKMVISLAEARDRLLPKLMSGELEV